MTPNEKVVLKEAIKKVVFDHLTSVGYPNLTKDKILAELPNMWNKIEEAKLNKEGLTYAAFVNHAHGQAMLAEMLGIFR